MNWRMSATHDHRLASRGLWLMMSAQLQTAYQIGADGSFPKVHALCQASTKNSPANIVRSRTGEGSLNDVRHGRCGFVLRSVITVDSRLSVRGGGACTQARTECDQDAEALVLSLQSTMLWPQRSSKMRSAFTQVSHHSLERPAGCSQRYFILS